MYSNSAIGLLRVCRDGMHLLLADQLADGEREQPLVGTLLRTGEVLFDDVFVLEPLSEPDPQGYRLVIETEVRWPLVLPGDRVSVGRSTSTTTPMAIGIVADCRLAEAGGWAHDPDRRQESIDTLPDARPGGAGVDSPRLLYLMAQESPANAGYVSLLTELDLSVTALTLAQAAALPAPNLGAYHQIVVADDTGELTADGPVWQGPATLRDNLAASGTPLLGIGAGGYSLLNNLRVSVAGQSRPIVTTTQVLTATELGPFNVAPVWPRGIRPGAVSLYKQPSEVVPGVNANRSSLHPLVSLAGVTTLPPLAVAGDRVVTGGTRCYSLWGFRAPPSALTGGSKVA